MADIFYWNRSIRPKRSVMIKVNLFGGPGAGKSTTASKVFAMLKDHNVKAELVSEFAKDLTWEKRHNALNCQPYVFGEQLWRMERLADRGVQAIVTDSPMLLSYLYGTNWPQSFRDSVVDIVLSQEGNMNFLLKRVKPYEPLGRNQTEEEAKNIDISAQDMLNQFQIQYERVPGDSIGASLITYRVLAQLGHYVERSPNGQPDATRNSTTDRVGHSIHEWPTTYY
jgi:hypothetical protein